MSIKPLILDRYIFKEFVIAFLAVMAFCALIILVASIFDRFSEILSYGAPPRVIVGYFLTSLPGELMQVVPIAAMLAVLFSIGSLARTNEVLAMMTSGVHGLRLAAPIIFGGIIIVAGAFVMNEYVVPPLERSKKIYDLQMEDKDIRKITMNANVFARGKDQWFYLARLYSNKEKTLLRPTIVHLNDSHTGIRERVDAESAIFETNNPDSNDSTWLVANPREWKFDASGNMTTFTENMTTMSMSLEQDLPTILRQQMAPDEMNFNQLKERIQILSERNQPVHALQTDLLHKIMFPLGILVIMLIGFSYGARTRPGTAMSVIGYGITWAVVYYVTNAIAQALGHAGTFSPAMATIAPIVVFFIIAIHYMRKSYLWHS